MMSGSPNQIHWISGQLLGFVDMVVSRFIPIMVNKHNDLWLPMLLLGIFCCNVSNKVEGVEFIRINAGLVDIPREIPCNASKVILNANAISRIEAGSFPCQTNTTTVHLGTNALVYIDPDAFQRCFSLTKLILSSNPGLSQLPPSFGPNTENMESLWVLHIGLQSLPNAFFVQFKSLQILGITDWGLNDPLDKAVFNGLSNLELLRTGCCSSIPNMTGHLPSLEALHFYGLPEDRIPKENLKGLHMSNVLIKKPCTYIPAFAEAVRLQTLDARECAVEELPDFSKHDALKEFRVDTTQFQCNPNCCWMLFEDLSAAGLAWVPNIICQGPSVLSGRRIADLSTLQVRCFESKSHHRYMKLRQRTMLSHAILFQMMHTNVSRLITKRRHLFI